MAGLNDKQRVEYVFSHERFMSDVRLKLSGGSLVDSAFARQRGARRYPDVYAAVLEMLNE